MSKQIVKENIPAGGVWAYTRGQTIESDAVKANGWEDFVVGEGTKEARQIIAEITGDPIVEDDTATVSRPAAAKTEQKG